MLASMSWNRGQWKAGSQSKPRSPDYWLSPWCKLPLPRSQAQTLSLPPPLRVLSDYWLSPWCSHVPRPKPFLFLLHFRPGSEAKSCHCSLTIDWFTTVHASWSTTHSSVIRPLAPQALHGLNSWQLPTFSVSLSSVSLYTMTRSSRWNSGRKESGHEIIKYWIY